MTLLCISVLINFLCLSITSYGMLPLIRTITDTAGSIMSRETMMNVSRTFGISGGLTNVASGEEATFFGSASFNCKYYNFQCINLTHSTYKEYCIPSAFMLSMGSDESFDAADKCDLNDRIRDLAIWPIAVFVGASVNRILSQRSPEVKKIVKMTACSVLYTAGCFYAFENYSDRGNAAVVLTDVLINLGNVLLCHQCAQ